MRIVESHHCSTHLDRSLPPAIKIDPGETIVVKTLDACHGVVRSVSDFERYRNQTELQSDPLTGPIFIRGALPGNGLVVHILSIELDEVGFQLIGPQRAIIRDEVTDWTCYAVRIIGNELRISNGMTLP